MSPEYLEMLLEGDKTLPEPDVAFGIEDEEGTEPPVTVPSVDELLQNSDVKAVVDAADGIEPAAIGA
jgi:hypothetical protein